MLEYEITSFHASLPNVSKVSLLTREDDFPQRSAVRAKKAPLIISWQKWRYHYINLRGKKRDKHALSRWSPAELKRTRIGSAHLRLNVRYPPIDPARW